MKMMKSGMLLIRKYQNQLLNAMFPGIIPDGFSLNPKKKKKKKSLPYYRCASTLFSTADNTKHQRFVLHFNVR